jgi:hypothetical protein
MEADLSAQLAAALKAKDELLVIRFLILYLLSH